MNKKSIIFISLILLFSMFFFSCTTATLIEKNKTVSVTGNAILSIEPDSASMRIRVSEIDKSTKEAQYSVNEKTSSIFSILEEVGVLKEDINTTGYEFSPEYEYIENKRELVGQRVSQSIYFVLREINTQDTRLSSILDRLADVSNISLGSITFSKEDMSGLYDEVRVLAMQDAMQKGLLYAGVAKLSLGDPLVISDHSHEAVPVSSRNEMMVKSSAMMDSAPQVPVSDITIRSSVQVTFALK